ncbi:MAG: AAA family ATPase [Actinobacteria bacterium]|nr:AAA family ATPase [Actinomycetota bacterium]
MVRASAGAYRVYLAEDLQVDIEQAAAGTDRAECALVAGEPATAGQLAAQARAVLGRPLLPGVEAPWLDGKRRELSRLLLRALEILAEARLVSGEYGHAVAAAEEAVTLDPFRESSHRLLIRAHLEAGNGAAGLWAYERCRQLLAEELGVDPAPETQALHAVMLRAGAALEPVAPVPRTSSVTARSAKVCPYRGLQTFEEADAEHFFGRDADVSRLLERLEASKFLAVLGPSGSGKSSLVRAGLIPALRQGALPASDTCAVRVLRPGSEPIKTLARELTRLDPSLDEPATARRLFEDDRALHRTVEAAADAGSPRVVFVVDQLEEVFTLCVDEEQRRAFLDALATAGTAPLGRVMVIATLRADFYPRLADHPRLADLASSHQFLVTPMDEVGLAEAIVGPARKVGLRLEEGLPETILRDVARQPGSLPLLGHCLLELWERRADGTLTVGAYRDAGGVEGALAGRAEAVYLSLSPDEQLVTRRVLLRLTQPGEGSHDTRRRVSFSELPTQPQECETVETVVDRLTEARLVTTGGTLPATAGWRCPTRP